MYIYHLLLLLWLLIGLVDAHDSSVSCLRTAEVKSCLKITAKFSGNINWQL